MPYIPQINHVERVRRLIDGRGVYPVTAGAAAADAARLASSYRRALDDYHLDPGASAGPRILGAAEVRAIQQGEEAFLRASGECLPRLHEMVREAGYCVLLSNARGVSIDCRIDHDHRKEFKRAGLYLGSCWTEQEEGTCAIAAALLDQAPITVHKTDHFRAAFTTLTCSAAPIFAPDGELIGVLNASALYSPDARDSQRLVNRLVRHSAALIEDAYFLKACADCWVLLAHRNRHYVEVQPEMLIAVDARGQIVAANRCARDNVAGLAALPRAIDEVFEIRAERLFTVRAGQDLLSLRLAGGGAWLHARVRVPVKRAPRPVRALPTGAPFSTPLMGLDDGELAERSRITAALTEARWQPLAAAALLGISRATLYRRLARLQIRPPHRS